MTSDETKIEIFCRLAKSHGKCVTKVNRKNLEYLVVAAIGKPRTDKNSRFGRKIMAKSK